MIQINLIPDVKREFLKTRALRNFVVTISIIVGGASIGLAVVLGLAFGGQIAFEFMRDENIKTEYAKMRAVEDLDKTVTIQQQLSKIDAQHDSKTINSRIFDVMRAINPPAPNDVKISSIKVDPENKTITISGSAANGYPALQVFKMTIQNSSIMPEDPEKPASDNEKGIPLASEITPGEDSFGENSESQRVLRFEFTFTYPEELFAPSDVPISIKTPAGKMDVTDSKTGIPDSIFGKRAEDLSDEAVNKEGTR